MKYSLDKYKFYQYKDKNGKDTVAAASTYAGRTVKGYAKCDPKDQFSIEKGKELAAARCNAKIASKRAKRAESKVEEAKMLVDEALAYLADMTQYQADACADEARILHTYTRRGAPSLSARRPCV